MPRHLSCKHCDKRFNKAFNLKRHAKHVHGVYLEKEIKINLRCPVCKEVMTKREEFIVHSKDKHNITLKYEQINFENKDDFETWKKLIEQNSKTCFVKNRGIRKNLVHFLCNRSGFYHPLPNRKRDLKTQGTVKINGYCPCEIKVKYFVDGKVAVDYCSTHIGHNIDLAHLPLEQRQSIGLATNMTCEIPFYANLKKTLRLRHNKSLQMKFDLIVENNGCWEIASSSGIDVYTVRLVEPNCNCRIRCRHCSSCIHKYSCTCIDACIKWNMCKHIHLLCQKLKALVPQDMDTINEQMSHYIDENQHINGNNVILEEPSTKDDDLIVERDEKSLYIDEDQDMDEQIPILENIGIQDVSISQRDHKSIFSIDEDQENDEKNVMLIEIGTKDDVSIAQRKLQIKHNFIKVVDRMTTTEDLKITEQILMTLESKLKASKRATLPEAQPSRNKNIQPQRQFLPLKHKPIANLIKRPTKEECKRIAIEAMLELPFTSAHGSGAH